ncbi:MAG: TorF family putative porin, partial [Gammaproteobacteria bacterium]
MRIVTSSLAAAALLATTSASAEVTANVGFMSNYVFRG